MIELNEVTKIFKDNKAVQGINLKIEKGDAFGFIGPNGAGKTTTIKMMSTLLSPTSGEIYIGGMSVVEEPERVKEILGYMPDHFGVYDGMKVWEYLDFFAASFRKRKAVRPGLINDVLELTDLSGKKDASIEVLSTGMKQRLCLAKTLLHDPEVLILDEPASGLDPRARIELKALLKELSQMGKTIFVSSHILPELADYCNKIGIIEKGQLIDSGDVQCIIDKTRPMRSFKLKVMGTKDEALHMLERLAFIDSPRLCNDNIQFNLTGEYEQIPELVEKLVHGNIRILGLWELETNLEDVFMKITKGELA